MRLRAPHRRGWPDRDPLLEPTPDRTIHSAPAHAAALGLIVSGAAMCVAGLVDLSDGGSDAAPFAAVGVAAVALGAIGRRRFGMPARAATHTVLGAVTALWIAMIATATVAYIAAGAFSRPDDALFESVAGFTTTAMSVTDLGAGPGHGVLFSRAVTQWIGGFVALVVIVALLPSLGVGAPEPGERLASSDQRYLLSPRLVTLIGRLGLVYVALTATGAVLFLVGGMAPFDAVTYGFTTISTGGFANHVEGFAHFDSAVLEWMAIAGMAVAGASFALLWRGLRGLTGSLLRSVELRTYLGILVVASAAVAVWTAPDGGLTNDSVRASIFSVTSVASTTGHAVVDWGGWVFGAQVLLLLLIGVGSMSGSAGGGFRVLRALALVGYMRREVVRQLTPRAVVMVKVGSVPLEPRLVARMIGYQVLFLLVLAVSAVAVAALGADLVTAGSAAVSALSTTGPALGDLAPGAGGALALTAPARAVVMGTMLLGRLEIYPVVTVAATALLAARRARLRVMAR